MPESGIEHTLLRAVRFAADRHRNQRRKDEHASPYINHPITVAETLSRHGVTDPVVLQAAILHDTIEDTETTPDELEQAFGIAVRKAVMEVTDDKSLDKQVRKQLQIQKAPTLSPTAKRVKLGDKIANVTDVVKNPPAKWDLERRRDYLEWARQVVDGCRDAHEGLAAEFDAICEEGFASLEQGAEHPLQTQPGE